MAREGLTGEAAFGVLSRASQRTNRKLRVVAEQIITSAPAGADGLDRRVRRELSRRPPAGRRAAGERQ
jgi:hypothetical protein